MNPLTSKSRYSIARILRKVAARVEPRRSPGGPLFEGLGAEKLSNRSPRALIIFWAPGIQRMVEGRLDDPIFKKHTIHGDTVAMVQELNRAGYIVDFCDFHKPFSVDWDRYRLIIDNWNYLKDVPDKKDRRKLAFMNGIHWLYQNGAELERIRWFKDRTGITVPTNRQMPSVLSDEHADYLTYYGNDLQANSFSVRPIKMPIELCGLMGPEPVMRRKNPPECRNRFMWIGGGGMLLKGVDVVLEAFHGMPEATLLVCGNLEQEPDFWRWAKPLIRQSSNIELLGWVDTTKEHFNTIADSCIGVVYASASEGGPASVARVLFNGLLPVVTSSSSVRAQQLGFTVEGASREQLISSIREQVRTVMQLPDKELILRAESVSLFARRNHTRIAFNRSFGDSVRRITNELS